MPIRRNTFSGLGAVLSGWLAAFALAVSPAAGQVNKFDPNSIPGVAFAPSADPVTVSVEAASESVPPGGRTVIAVTLDHAPGWHSHTNDPNPPASWGFEAWPTSVEVSGPEGLLVGAIQWPETYTISADLGGTGTPEPYDVFDGRATAFVPIGVPEDATGTVSVQLTVSYQACDDTICDRPQTETFDVVFAIDPASADGVVGGALFSDFDEAAGFGSLASVADAENEGAAEAAGALEVTRSVTPVSLLRLLGLGLGAALGGFVLNLTPCVLPVIPIKVMTLVKHGGESRGRTLMLGVWMALGVVTFWLAIGAPMAFVNQALDPSRLLFGNWWVTLAIGLLIAALGVGIMGMFTLNLPNAVYAVNPRADSPHGSFLFGVMTAVLGLPCFGFVAGAVLAGAATMPSIEIITVFGGLGVGMAAPYLVLAAFPRLVERIPRTGPASELVKQVMGLLMFAAAAFFIAVGLHALISEHPWMARNMKWWGATVFIALAGLWLAYRTVQITKSPVARSVFSLIAAVGTAASAWWAVSSTAGEREVYMARASIEEPDGYLLSGWNEYSPERFERAIADGKVVVVDFTAEWCLNCKAYKRAVLDQDPVRSRMDMEDVVTFEADVTLSSDPANDLMEELGVTGIPLLGIWGPGLGQPLLSNSASGGEVVRRIEQASGRPIESAGR